VQGPRLQCNNSWRCMVQGCNATTVGLYGPRLQCNNSWLNRSATGSWLGVTLFFFYYPKPNRQRTWPHPEELRIIRADIFPAPVRGICCTSGATLSVVLVHDNLWRFLLNMSYKCPSPQVTDTCTSFATIKWNPQDFIWVKWQLHFQGKKPNTDVSFGTC